VFRYPSQEAQYIMQVVEEVLPRVEAHQVQVDLVVEEMLEVELVEAFQDHLERLIQVEVEELEIQLLVEMVDQA
jgi:hypothetical protein